MPRSGRSRETHCYSPPRQTFTSVGGCRPQLIWLSPLPPSQCSALSSPSSSSFFLLLVLQPEDEFVLWSARLRLSSSSSTRDDSCPGVASCVSRWQLAYMGLNPGPPHQPSASLVRFTGTPGWFATFFVRLISLKIQSLNGLVLSNYWQLTVERSVPPSMIRVCPLPRTKILRPSHQK